MPSNADEDEPSATENEGFSGSTTRRRDPDLVQAGLERWLPSLLDVKRVRVSDLQVPSGAGFSNETYIFLASSHNGHRGHGVKLVVQAAPLSEALFQQYDLAKMHALQTELATAGVPVPHMRGYEASSEPLGAPFYVMDYIDGQVPADNPSYMAEGFVVEASPRKREAMWWSAVEAMARLHRLDPGRLSPELRGRLGPVEDAIPAKLDFWEQFVTWASPDRLPCHEEALVWLRTHCPTPSAPLSVTWGDPKLGNVLFVEERAEALIDWELCGVGYAEEDLAEFLWMAEYAAISGQVERLEGIPDDAETARRYAELLDRPLDDAEWWRFFAIYRLSAIIHRIMHQVRALGGFPLDADLGRLNPAAALVRRELERRGVRAA